MMPYQNYVNPYQNYNYNMQPQMPQQMPQQADERIWVQNDTSAEAYLVAPSGFVRLWDSSGKFFYEKRADASGRPYPMKKYEYKEVNASDQIETTPKIDYMEEINALKERISALEKKGKPINAKSNTNDATT